MNGKKVKALRRAFQQTHGRAPVGPQPEEVSRFRFSELPAKVQADLNAKGKAPLPEHGDAFFSKTVRPAQASEIRRLKKGTLNP